jgi:hypothetical protein
VKSATEIVAGIPREQQLLLRAVLLDGAPARAAFREWRELVVIDDVDGVSQRLLPVLARRLPAVGPDDPVRGLIRGIYRHAWVRSHRLWRDALPVFTALRARGIPIILLKGAALLHAYGDDWGARPMFDIDALVPPELAVEATRVLEELGWGIEYDMTYDWVRSRALTRRHGWGFLRGDGRLDLHWHVLSESIGSRSDTGFWAAAEPLEIEGFRARTLSPPDLLLHLLVHGTSGGNAPAVQWIADAIHVVRTYGADAIADRFARQARAHGELTKVGAALDAVSAVVDPHVCAPITARLRRERAGVVERLRHHGVAAGQLAQRAAGGNGLARGTAELVTDRLDLGLATAPAVSVAHAASGRSPTVGRAARRHYGTLTRAPVPSEPLAAGADLDFTQPATLDRYGGTGWGRAEEAGATTRGAEARLVLPLVDTLTAGDLQCELTVHARTATTTIDVRANETLVTRAAVATGSTTLDLTIPSTLLDRDRPLELSLRRAPGSSVAGRRGPVNLRVERVRVRGETNGA